MEQQAQGRAPGKTSWYVISANHVKAVRVYAGMTIGETQSGELSFDRDHAQLRLDVERDSLLVLRSLRNLKIASNEGTKGQTDCMTCNRSVAISLSQNMIQINTEFVNFAPSRRPLQLQVVYPPSDKVVTEAPAESSEPVNPLRTQSTVVASSGSSLKPAHSGSPEFNRLVMQTETRRRSRGTLDQSQALTSNLLARLSMRRRVLGGLAVTMITFVVGMLVINPSTSTTPPDETDEVLQMADTEVGDPLTVRSGGPSERGVNFRLSSVAPVTTPAESLEEMRDTETDGDIRRSTDERPLELPPERASELQAVSTPQVASVPQAVDIKSGKAERAERTQAQARATDSDLAAAEVALSENRLMLPENSSALALYRRVLSHDPDSPGALKGIATVSERLINRAFAQLAAGQWNQVPETLDAAEKAGATGNLVEDLRGEASYQMRLARRQSGQFDDLYPSQQLDVIAQKSPRLSRWRTSGHQQVEVEFTVTMRGDVRDVHILGAPPPRLADTIRGAVETWRFEPVLEHGRPLPVRTRVLIEIGS